MTPDLTTTAPARLATRLSFFAAGFVAACCAPLLPFFKSNVGADEAQFGLLLLCLGLGSIIAMPVSGTIAARRGSKPMILLGGFGLIALLPIMSLAQTPIVFGAALFVFGASLGTIDVSMNVHGAEVEALEKRPLMSNFHAMFSIGGFFGAGLMTVLLSLSVSVTMSSVIGGCVAAVAMLISAPRLMSAKGHEPEPFAFPKGIVVLLAVLAGLAFLAEGAILDWSALLLIDLDLSAPQNAGVGYIVFSVAMVFARLLGDRIVAILGGFNVLAFGGVLTMAGFAIVLIAPTLLIAMLGFVLVGLGAANLVPILFSAAGRQTIMPAGLAIASVTTTGYAGILMGPAIIGFVADGTSLPTAFWFVVAGLAAFPLTARIVARV